MLAPPWSPADEAFMRQTLALAAEAEAAGEVPIGAIVVMDGAVAGRGRNSPIALADPTAHAEILAIREAAHAAGNYRLEGATLYVTLEPCAMCAGAIVNARINRLVFGSRDLRFGGVRSKFRIADSDVLNHRVEIVEGVCSAECVESLKQFFRERRTSTEKGLSNLQTREEIDQLLRSAIEHRRIVQLRYGNRDPIIEPHDYGIQNGSPRLLAYQIGGSSTGPLPNWRWMDVNEIAHLELLDRTFPGGRTPTGKHHNWDRLYIRVRAADENSA